MTRNVGCLTVEPLLSSYPAGALDEASERLVRDHLAECAACRALQRERDPSVLFLEMRRAPLPEGFLDGLAKDVRVRLEAERRRPFASLAAAFNARRWAYVAAPVTTLVLLGTLFLVRPGGLGPGGRQGHDGRTVPSPYLVAPGSAQLGKPGAGSPGSFVVPPAQLESGAPPLMEDVGSPSARIYKFTVGSGSEETPIYLVVDESIDIR